MSFLGLVMVVELFERRSSAELSVSPCSAGPRLVVVIGGEADCVTADQLRAGLAAAHAYGPRSMVLDLTDLVFCSLQGLRALVAAVETAEEAGVDVTLHGMSQQLTWLYDIFQAERATYAKAVPARSPQLSVTPRGPRARSGRPSGVRQCS